MPQDVILQQNPRIEWKVKYPEFLNQYLGRRVEMIATTALREVFDTTGHWLLTFGVCQ